MKNGKLIVKPENHAGVDDQDIAKSSNQKPFHLDSCILAHSRRLVNNVNRERDCFYSKNIYYGDTDSAYILKKNTGPRWLITESSVYLLDLEKTIMVIQVYTMFSS